MKKIIFLIMLAATVVACNQTPCPEKNWEEEYLLAKSEIEILEAEVAQLRVDTTALRGEILCLQSKLRANGLSIKCLDEPAVKKVSPAPKPAPVVKKNAPTPKRTVMPPATPEPAARTEQPEPAAPIAKPAVKEVEPSLSVLDKFIGEDEFGEFVLQINNLEGGHFPHLAMMKGQKFTSAEVVSNYAKNGYNFKITKTTKGFTDRFGLEDNGILYVKTDLVSQAYRWPIKTAGIRFNGHWHENVQCTIMKDENGTVYGVDIKPFLK